MARWMENEEVWRGYLLTIEEVEINPDEEES